MCMEQHIDLLQTIAKDVTPVRSSRIAAMVIYKDRVVSVGINQMKSHPFAARFSKNPHAIYLHAETDAILKASRRLDRDQFVRSTLLICRVKYDLNSSIARFGLCKPCAGCERCIENYKIRCVQYTVESPAGQLRYETMCYNDF
jgi:deoxycytidylate deaminase